MNLLRRLYVVFLLLALLSIPLALYASFIYAPNEQFMGAVQRIFYFHVGAAVASYVCFAILFIGSIVYLATNSVLADVFAEAAGEVAFLLCTVVLVSGMIWGKAVWGVWFNTEPRLLSFLLLWFLTLGYVLLRSFASGIHVSRHSAVLGIVACVSVPLMIFSIKLLPAVKQLHPEVIEKGGLASEMKVALVSAIIAMLLVQGTLVLLRARIGLLQREMENTN